MRRIQRRRRRGAAPWEEEGEAGGAPPDCSFFARRGAASDDDGDRTAPGGSVGYLVILFLFLDGLFRRSVKQQALGARVAFGLAYLSASE